MSPAGFASTARRAATTCASGWSSMPHRSVAIRFCRALFRQALCRLGSSTRQSLVQELAHRRRHCCRLKQAHPLTLLHQLTSCPSFSSSFSLSVSPSLSPALGFVPLSCFHVSPTHPGRATRTACPRLPDAFRDAPLGLLLPAARGNDARGGRHVRAGFRGSSRLPEGRNSRECTGGVNCLR